MSILLDILLGAVFGISIIVLTYIIYRIQETKSAKNKRKETTQELNENILTLKKQRTFLAKKCQRILLENDRLKSKLWTASINLNNKDSELMEAKEKLEKENKQLKETNENLFSKMKGFIRTNTAYNA